MILHAQCKSDPNVNANPIPCPRRSARWWGQQRHWWRRRLRYDVRQWFARLEFRQAQYYRRSLPQNNGRIDLVQQRTARSSASFKQSTYIHTDEHHAYAHTHPLLCLSLKLKKTQHFESRMTMEAPGRRRFDF